MNNYGKIRERLRDLPVIDSHEHICDHRESRPLNEVSSFILGQWMNLVVPDAAEDLPDRERWKMFLNLWPRIRATGPGFILAQVLQAWGIDENLNEASYDAILAKLQTRSPESAKEAFRRAKIKAAIPHYLAHPFCGGVANIGSYFEGSLQFEDNFFPLLGTIPLHEFHRADDIRLLEPIAGMEIGSLETLIDAVEKIISKAVAQGVVGMKDHAAYSRGLSYGLPNRREAEKELQLLLTGFSSANGTDVIPQTNTLSDFVFHRIVQAAIEHGIPIALHSGMLAGGEILPKGNLKNFTAILELYQEARFEIYHLNYPWIDEMYHVLRTYPNTFANCNWAQVIDPAATEEFLYRAVSSFPADRIIGFGGDYLDSAERQLGSLELSKNTIARALSRAVSADRISIGSAVEIASLWLYENPKTLYDLKL